MAAALFAIGRIGGNRGRVFLSYYFARPMNDDRLRAVAIQALAASRSPEAVVTLKEALLDKDVNIRRSAAIGLGQVDFGSRFHEELAKLQDDIETFDGDGEISRRAEGEFSSYLARLRVKLEEDERRPHIHAGRGERGAEASRIGR